MNPAILFEFLLEEEQHQIKVHRSFHASLDLVWSAWTEADILDQWWAPKPYIAITKTMNFKEGGHWHYYMESPEGEKHWCLFEFTTIEPLQSFSGIDAFCNEQAVIHNTKPRVIWQNQFIEDAERTLVNITLQFESLADLETIIKMGFKEGFTAGLENLDQYFLSLSHS